MVARVDHWFTPTPYSLKESGTYLSGRGTTVPVGPRVIAWPTHSPPTASRKSCQTSAGGHSLFGGMASRLDWRGVRRERRHGDARVTGVGATRCASAAAGPDMLLGARVCDDAAAWIVMGPAKTTVGTFFKN